MASVDVAIPCYQHGRFLRDCVDSVLGQGIRDTRILIIDNGSTDDSLDVARQLASEDPRVEVAAHTKNLGPHASFNEGVDWASADYFMVLCADDLLTPGSLKRAVSVLEQHLEASFALGTDVLWAEGAPCPTPDGADADPAWLIQPGGDFIRDRCRNPECNIAAGMVLVRTSAQKAAGHYRPELPHTDDFEMLLRLACLGQVAVTRAVQGIKRFHGANRTDQFLAERTRDLVERVSALESFFGREGKRLPNARRLLRLGLRSISERAYWCGVKDLVRGRRSAYDLLKLAVTLEPSVAVIPPLNYLLRMKTRP